MVTYVYKISHKLSGRVYYGITHRSPSWRWTEHARSPTELGQAIRRHGRQAFTFEVLQKHETRAEAEHAEFTLISRANDEGVTLYNLRKLNSFFRGAFGQHDTEAEWPDHMPPLDEVSDFYPGG